jgi:hypothetical protein
MAKRELATLAYDALTLDGGLFNAEWLGRVAHLDAPQQKPENYGIPAGLTLRDEIARAWRIAQALWLKFQPSLAAGTGAHAATERFVTSMLEQAFGFVGLEKCASPRLVGDRTFPTSHALKHVPMLIAAYNEGLDDSLVRLAEGGRRRSPFGVMQEYLNESGQSLWGLVTNGLRLRLVRNNTSLTRPAWLEADLQRIFTEERFADFSVLWLTIHASRFGRPDAPPTECALEVWRTAGQQTGTRAREELREGVERALVALGQGFLSEPSNTALRGALVDGLLTRQGYFQQLLRLVYRIIFLLTVEERAVLHPPGTAPHIQQLYERGYSLRRLRERAVRHSAHDTHCDLYASLKITLRGLAEGEPRLALPALGGLFGTDQTPLLDAAVLQNRHLLSAIWALAWIARDGSTERVNWRDMGPEELGSVYESLLELEPLVSEGTHTFKFAGDDETRGNARKLSGSYYTPDSLVQALLDAALEPVIAQRRAERRDDEAAAILSIKVIDPAVGSGHFLLGAARRLATHLARFRAQGQPGPAEHRRALREVVSHCLFGVDRNPMALELAKIALWLEAMTPEAPLSFLDTHLVLGDALLGLLDPVCLAHGIPDDAYKPLTGDIPEVCARLKTRNRQARRTLERLTGNGRQELLTFATETVAAALSELDALPDDTLEQVAAKHRAYAGVREKQMRTGLAEDLLLGAFLMPKQPQTEAQTPTSEHLMRAITGQPVDTAVVKATQEVARKHNVFHWRDAFAHVFAHGGFDCVLGNPPWERIKLQEQEFFASRAPAVANARNKAERARAIAVLEQSSPSSPERRIFDEFAETKRASEAASTFAHGGIRYPLTGTGDVNTYALFAETALTVLSPKGHSGLVLPTGIVTDDSTSEFFAKLAEGQLREVSSFENEEFIFPGVHHAFRFCLNVWSGEINSSPALLRFFLRQPQQLRDSRRTFSLTRDDFLTLNPNSRTCPVFRSQADAELTKRLYSRLPVLWKDGNPNGNTWGLSFLTMFHMANDSAVFHTAERVSQLAQAVPLYEAKMIHQFDHRWATYSAPAGAASIVDDESRELSDEEKSDVNRLITPRYYVDLSQVQARTSERRWQKQWFLTFRDITGIEKIRTVIAAIAPFSAVGHTLPVIFATMGGQSSLLSGSLATAHSLLLANLNAIVLDYIARQKVGGTHLTYGYLKQFAMLPPAQYDADDLSYIVPRVLQLTYSATDLRCFYEDVIAENPGFDLRSSADRDRPFLWDPGRRAQLRAELDAYYARLYGLTRDELRYILDPADVMGAGFPSETFRVLKEKEIREFGEYRTRRLVLEAWDALERAQTLVVPPIQRADSGSPHTATIHRRPRLNPGSA